MASKYIKSKSNYVYRSQHQKTSGGTVFERDFMTVSSFDAMSPSERQVYGINNFKFQVRSGLNEQKKHNNGRWIPDYEAGNEQNITPKKTGTRLNPDYESMKDFAYYGSAVNLVKASVVEVLLNFPAELYFTDKEFREKVTGGTASVYYLVSNDYGIDVITEDVDEETVENELRYLAKSLNKYVIFEPITNTGNSFAAYESCPSEITIHHYNRSCEEISNGTIIADAVITITENGNVAETLTIYAYQRGDDITLLHSDITKVGYRIRPNQTYIDEFFDNASDFVRVLLNRDTNPLYMATFNTPYETEKGFFTYKRNYIWPTTYGWNPDISNAAYENYLESLIALASYHDEFDSDNIWRSMTHEAIKNLDWTFTREKGDDTIEFETIDTTKIEPILKVYGRQYDDLKRFADVISKSGNVTYNKKNNVPDNALATTLKNSGWEVTSVNNMLDLISVSYDGGNILYDKDGINSEFYRRLRVNSSYLHSMKGTKKGLVSLLGLFGLKEFKPTENVGDFIISEYIALAGPAPVPGSTASTYPSYEKVASYNRRKYNFDMAGDDALYGLPLKKIFYEVEGQDYSYVVPWYENGRTYDNDLYFQMNGGWGRTDKMKVNNTDFSQYREYIESDANFKLYNETISDLKYAATLDDMLELGRAIVRTDNVCYVTDLSGLAEKYSFGSDTSLTVDNASHYFYLEDDTYSSTLGYVTVDGSATTAMGWKCVPLTEIESTAGTLSKEAKKVYYLESIVDNTEGNNPHMGHSRYDDGREYMQTMFHPFNPAIEKANFATLSDEELLEVTACSFTSSVDNTDGRLDKIVDNKKCWYFTDRLRDLEEGEAVTDDKKVREVMFSAATDYKYDYGTIPITATEENTGVTITFDNNSATPYNPETGGENNDISAANSIINSKRLSIIFIEPTSHFRTDASAREIDKRNYRDFITNKVLFYLKQLIPATTLFEYSIEEESTNNRSN